MNQLLALILALAIAPALAIAAPRLQDGDLIFQTSQSSQSQAIQLATRSPYSHMGVLFIRSGQLLVLEAAASVRYTPLEDWIRRGVRSQYIVKRLKTPLTPEQIQRLRATAPEFVGKPYDLTFDWSDTRIYCSELVWKLYDRALGIRIGSLQKLRDFSLTHPEVRARMRERYGENLPLDSTVISPAAMFKSSLLKEVDTK